MKTIKVLLMPVILLSLFLLSCEEVLDERKNKIGVFMYKGLEHEGNESTDLLLTNGELEVSTVPGEEGVLGISLQSEKSLNMYMEPVSLGAGAGMDLFVAKSKESKDDPIVGISMEKSANGEQLIKGFASNSDNVRLEGYKDGKLVYRNDEFEGRWLWLPIALYVLDHVSAHADYSHTTNSDGTSSTTYSAGVDWGGTSPDTNGGNVGARIDDEGLSIEVDYIRIVAVEDGLTTISNPYVEVKTQNIDKYTILDEDVNALVFLPPWGLFFGNPDFMGGCSGSGFCGIVEYPYPHLPYVFAGNEAKLIGTSQPESNKVQLEFDASHFTQGKIQEVFGGQYFLMQEPAVLGNELVRHLNKKYGEITDAYEIVLSEGQYEIENFYTQDGQLQSCGIPFPIITPWGIYIIEVKVVFIKI